MILSFLVVTPFSGFTQKNGETIVVTKSTAQQIVHAKSVKDSIENAIAKEQLRSEQLLKKNIKVTEQHMKLTQIEEFLEKDTSKKPESIKPLITEQAKVKYKPTRDFKDMKVDYKGNEYYVVKDSTCTEYSWKSIFQKKKCIKYDYFLTIKQ